MSDGRERLAREVIELASSELLATHHYLAPALGRMKLVPGELACVFSADGKTLVFDVNRVLDGFAVMQSPPVHDLLHSVLHCVLLHPFSGDAAETRTWDLACDICVERLAAQLLGPRAGKRGIAIGVALSQVETACTGNISAQRLYRRMQAGAWVERRADWEELFRSDDHGLWRLTGAASQASPNSEEGFDSEGEPGLAAIEGESESGASVGREIEEQGDDERLDEWKRIARSLDASIVQSHEAGKRAGVLMEEVAAVTRERVDYARWLRQFAVMGEHLRLSDEEFDPVFYTYGLRRYGNLPLIEPLEQHEERRIKEFVIVIDTSQSVSGDIVHRFVDETCAILRSTTSFAEQLHVRILQCDAEVQSDDSITSVEELEAWGRSVELRGFGGTDFRPAFSYVDGLLERGEFRNLGGLVYFTDGWGIYPEKRPEYRVAFAFYDDDHRAEDVPPWAVQIVLNDVG